MNEDLLVKSATGLGALLANAAASVPDPIGQWASMGATGLTIALLIFMLKRSEDLREQQRKDSEAERAKYLEGINRLASVVEKVSDRLDVVDQMKELMDERMPPSRGGHHGAQ